MSACHTCKQKGNEQAQRVSAVIKGAAYIQDIEAGKEYEGCLKAANYFLRLADQYKPEEAKPSNG